MSSKKSAHWHQVKLHIVNYSTGKDTVNSNELKIEVKDNLTRLTADTMIYDVIREMEKHGLFSFIRMKYNTRIYLVNF